MARRSRSPRRRRTLASGDAFDRALGACRLSPSECVLRHVTRASRAVVAAFDEALRAEGLTGQQFNLLMTLARAGPLTVNGLAAQIGVDPTTVPRALAPLTRDRQVTVGVGADRRERVIAVTRLGRRRLAAALPRWEALQQSILRAVGHGSWASSIARLREIRQATLQPASRDTPRSNR